MRKKSIATLVLAALLTLALAATALAVAMRAGLLEFFQGRDAMRDPSAYEYQLGREGALLSATYGDLEITVTEGAGRLDHYAMVATVAMKPGAPGVLSHYSVEPVEAKEGVPVYHIDCTTIYEKAAGDVESTLANEDGSFSFLSELNNVMESADTAQMYCILSVAKEEAGQPIGEVRTEMVSFPFTMRVEDALDARRMEGRLEVPEAAVVVDALYLKQTAGGVFANLYYRYDGGAATGYTSPEGLYVSLGDAEGRSLLEENHRFIGSWMLENRYLANIQLDVESLPDTVEVRFHDEEGNILGRAMAQLERAESLPASPGDYRRPSQLVITHRDIPLPGREYLPYLMYVSAPEGEDIPLLASPEDPDSTIVRLPSGIEAEVYGEYNEWALVGFGELYAYESGYVKKTQLTESPEEVRPGVHRAELRAQAEVRYVPDPLATISGRLEAGEKALVLGEKGDWYYLIADGEGENRARGYVQKNAVEVTGEPATVELKDISMYYSYAEP